MSTGVAERYEDRGLIGMGGQAEVRRVHDRRLGRDLAMKILRSEFAEHEGLRSRFVEEAEATAQLQHPGIVPVHDLGEVSDGRPFFVMKEVSGQTFTQVITSAHECSSERWAVELRGLVNVLQQVSRALAYAHMRGVLHRDLKPDNVMVGDFGEVVVMDWGLAKVQGRADPLWGAFGPAPVVTERSRDASQYTVYGTVSGTPAYMPPEQASGSTDEVDARSDVYALGAMLYEVLVGVAPYSGESSPDILSQVVQGPPPPVRAASSRALPEELVVLCERAMSRERHLRPASAMDLSSELSSWLDGARRREQALEVAESALANGPEALRLRAEAEALEVEAEGLLSEVASWEPEKKKLEGWSKQDEAASLRRQADRVELSLEQGLQGALRIDPQLPEAHAALAERYLAQHASAEETRATEKVMRAEVRVTTHAESLPFGHEVRQRCAAYLKGDGALTLVTDPPGAEVELYRYVERNRRLVAEPVRSLGRTPLAEVSLEMGSYLCLVKHPKRTPVHYPVHIGRGEHWHGVPPEGGEPHPVWLPRPEELGEDDCYVPAGWFTAGGDESTTDAIERTRLWCDGLVMKRYPVTNREYIAFLDDLVRQGREEDALRWAPRERAGQHGEQGALIYGRRSDGRFELVADAEGDTWLPDWPVVMVDWGCAAAYARWLASTTGLPWRLPGEWEWEKSARGVDGRWYPWGDFLDPSRCCMRHSHPGRLLPAVVDTYPLDVSVYGVRGLGGNVTDWCADLFVKEGSGIERGRVITPELQEPDHVDLSLGSRRVNRGGNWLGFARGARCASRWDYEPSARGADLGVRLSRSFPSSL